MNGTTVYKFLDNLKAKESEIESQKERINKLKKQRPDRDSLKKAETDLNNLKLERQHILIQIKDYYGENKVREWIRNGITQDTVIYAENVGKYLSSLMKRKENDEALSTSQIRNIFGEVKRMQISDQFSESKLLLLKPQMAYSAKRANKQGVEELRDLMNLCIETVIEAQEDQSDRFENFANFFEAILAYHRAFGGK